MKYEIPVYALATLRGYVAVDAGSRADAIRLAIQTAQRNPDTVRVWDYSHDRDDFGHPNGEYDLDTHPRYKRYEHDVYANEAPPDAISTTKEIIAVIDSVDLTDSRVLASLERECLGNRYAQSYLYIRLIDLAYATITM